MRYSYGIMDRRKILLYNPQLFLKGNDILVFPSKDFHKWHGDIKEYIDGLYQINSRNLEKLRPINLAELNLSIGVIHNISQELENLFNLKAVPDSYQYISTLNKKYKKRKSGYSSDMGRCDIQIPVKLEITAKLKYKHQMEIVEEAWNLFTRVRHKKTFEDRKI
jgi:hypothetical protein